MLNQRMRDKAEQLFKIICSCDLSERRIEEIQKALIFTYMEGQKSGVEAFSWWKDGVEYVGQGNRSKQECFDLIEQGEIE